jgi:hypothetical protein
MTKYDRSLGWDEKAVDTAFIFFWNVGDDEMLEIRTIKSSKYIH